MRVSLEELGQMLGMNPDIHVPSQIGMATPLSLFPGQTTLSAYIPTADEDSLSEHQMQVRIVNWAKANEGVCPLLKWMFAVPNGGKRNVGTAVKLKAEGVKKGVPDLWLPVRTAKYTGVVLENKVGYNKTSPEQREWITFLQEQGWLVKVCYNAAEAIEVLREYLTPLIR